MADLVKYKTFKGTVEYSATDECLHGQVVGIPDTIIYGGNDIKELISSFRIAVDEYIVDSKALGKPIKKSYSGHFSVRIKPTLHQQLDYLAHTRNTSVSKIIEEVVENNLD